MKYTSFCVKFGSLNLSNSLTIYFIEALLYVENSRVDKSVTNCLVPVQYCVQILNDILKNMQYFTLFKFISRYPIAFSTLDLVVLQNLESQARFLKKFVPLVFFQGIYKYIYYK